MMAKKENIFKIQFNFLVHFYLIVLVKQLLVLQNRFQGKKMTEIYRKYKNLQMRLMFKFLEIKLLINILIGLKNMLLQRKNQLNKLLEFFNRIFFRKTIIKSLIFNAKVKI
ncbi:hypothetical protein IMG5_204010 [Ichthyophthirius multifiliis]|uniref:Transmembrane protein n=1 Tax=Ichthyophthirius multifiliis TaxID=5932 RepID=G0R6F9_ICHMU|nr:hypothetical protein IMG5_204010 [Ichthyophthirius multifiliis]EGR26950.1 hypothetical protein IMG5_204010 [Ichthyophthirius multifiliis]|eukprot:XP_004023834.1 hypothetical protein IMG5_204010 [Ichthyophthirius multifiliis]